MEENEKVENDKWGVGNRKDEKAFDTIKIHGEEMDLIFGEHPHSRRDNTTYARSKNGSITGFDGHRICFKIEIEENNYMKSSHLSGDEIRKGGSVKVFANGVQVLDDFTRGYENGYRKAHNFIISMEENWSWFPKNVEEKIGTVIGYQEQLFRIKSFVVSQACMILETLDGKSRKKWLWEDEEDFDDGETSIKVEITSEHLTWYPKYEGQPAAN